MKKMSDSDLDFALEVFPKIKDLSEPDKTLVLEKIRESVTKAYCKTKDAVFVWKLFFFGIVTGVVSNLWASILYDFLKKYWIVYIIILICITIILINKLLNIFINDINVSMSENPISKKLWEYINNNKTNMQQKILYIFGTIIFLVGGVFLIVNYTFTQQDYTTHIDYKNIEYIIDGQHVQLINGVSEIPVAPDARSKIVTRYFGNEVFHDLNDDGREDIIFLLTQEQGGSGTFFYVVAALNTETGYVGSQAFFLGDRIAPQTTEVSRNHSHKNVIIVNYAERKTEDPMTTQPSIGKSIWLKLDPQTMQFGEVMQDFEGEVDPSVMALGMKPWVWVRVVYNDGKIITPKKSQAFTITLGEDGKFSATTDCNSVGGRYTATKDKITFNNMMSTLMYCEGSEEAVFTKILGESQSYHFSSKGELIIDLKFDSGSIIFK